MWLVALAFIRRIPWWAYAIIAAALVVLGYGHARYKAGEAHERPIAYREGQLHQDAIWRKAIAKAAAEHQAIARATEARQAAIAKQTGDTYAHNLADLRAAYDRLRRQRAGNVNHRAAGQTDLSQVPSASGGVDGAAGSDIIVSTPLSVIEQGDFYREQVKAWQDWYQGVAAQ